MTFGVQKFGVNDIQKLTVWSDDIWNSNIWSDDIRNSNA